MSNYSAWFEDEWDSKKQKTVVQIKEQIIYESLSSEIVQKVEANLPANEIVDWIKNKTRDAYYERYHSQVEERGALNKVGGKWNEFMVTTALSEIAIDMNSNSRGLVIVIFSLPNTKISVNPKQISSRFLSLFKRSAFSASGELYGIDNYKDRIFFSSPDYVIVVFRRNRLSEVQSLLNQQARKPSSNLIYSHLKETLEPNELKAAISVKTEYRPDRRYQPLFEADLVKQLGYLTGQRWKYYMVSGKETRSDKFLFDRIMTPDAYRNNYKLVDGSFVFLRKADLIPLVEAAIR